MAHRLILEGYTGDSEYLLNYASASPTLVTRENSCLIEIIQAYCDNSKHDLYNLNTVEALLSCDFLSVGKFISFEEITEDINRVLVDVKSQSFDFSTLHSALRLAIYSPYQPYLMKFIFDRLNELGYEKLLESLSENKRSLAFLIQCFNSSVFLHCNYGNFKKIYNDKMDINKLLELLSSKFEIRDKCSSKYNNLSKIRLDRSNKNSTLTLGTILLNEQKYIGSNLIQHYMHCDEWILVEGACLGYPPRKVSEKGLSLDATNLILRLFPDRYNKLQLVEHGWTKAAGEDAKSELRNEYMKRCSSTYLLVLDADEFYLPEVIDRTLLRFDDLSIHSITLPQVHFWKDLTSFITGEYYDISHTRFFRFIPGSRYERNHNFPEVNGEFLHKIKNHKVHRKIVEMKNCPGSYQYADDCCYHLGFAKDFDDMRDKSDYYINRGEDKTRVTTTASRAAWFSNDLTDNLKVRNWGGVIPSVLLGGDQ